ncbi:DNA primase large subunit-like [Ruditapes philippinarum]|uniref:DNA primase large subunit-like n=1 Tax=Ruditapes philippinarum TaxID=129788 RepID=UPI00295B4031|nr:DNA primase large subunit-like [Ruditapes philippinarum]
MQFSGGSKRRNKQLNNKINDGSNCQRIQLYKLPPTDTISLYEFEDFAVERLKVLKAVETAGEKYMKTSDEYETFMRDQLRNTRFSKLTKSDREAEDDELRRMDHISHFILRLAYCRSEELRRWFLTQEMDLFRFRFKLTSDEHKKEFLKENNLNYESISSEEKTKYQEQLAVVSNKAASSVETIEYFKVHFTEVLDLVQKRKVYLHKGKAFVPYTEMISLLIGVYRAHLSQALAITARALPHLEEDERLLPMLCGLSKRYIGSDYNLKKTSVGQVTADMIEMLSKKSFPLCMSHLHTSMRQNHHLRHGGRQQYGLFLKGIGLSLEEAIKFWRSEFTKLIDVDKFDKQYLYNIRHNYGKEGKRADYTPYSCMKIIMSNAPGPGDAHGCPFKHTDMDLLKQKLKNMAVGDSYLEKIMSEVKAGRYNVACTRYFEAAHKLPVEYQAQAFSHPNQYFEESQRTLNGENKTLSIGTPKTPRSQGSSQQSQGTPKSQQSQGTPKSQQVSSQSTSQNNGHEDMMDDDFDITEAEMSMQADR